MSVAQPSAPDGGLVSLIDCPYWPVYFRRDAAELDQQQRGQLDNLADMIREFEISDRALVVLAANAGARDQKAWSTRRLDIVRTYLISHGLNAASLRISPAPAGERELLGGPPQDPSIGYVVYRILVPSADRERLFPPGSPLC